MKDYYKIGEISKIYGIGRDSLMYYEDIGILKPFRDKNGYRMYKLSDIWRLNLIKELRSLNFPMKKIKEYLDDRNIESTKEILNKENCLVISETTGNIILPYYIKDLENDKNTNKTYGQIIQDNYTLPINLFKPTFVARFREAFKLAHNKEKKSIIFSLNLATELVFNYNLHPAIITACRNLDELDIYLDCLENNETEKFKCFNIIF